MGAAMTSDNAKDKAMLPPTIAIATVLTCSRVRSATHAEMAAEMAPAPIMPRPIPIQSKSS